MCGRYATTRSTTDLAALFDAVDETGDALGPDYNVAPTDPVPVVRVTSAGHRAVSVARWGLVPAWAKDPRGGARMINARAERVADAPAFARSFARRRCLVPADGWYEWRAPAEGRGKQDGRGKQVGRGRKQAYFMTPRDGAVLALAGLWAVWGSGPDRLITCSIVTTAALGELAAVHDRMPLALPPVRWSEWLTGTAGADRLLAPPPDEVLAGLEIRPVGPAVGDVRNDGPGLIELVSNFDDQMSMTLSGRQDPEPTDLTLF
jgi:putative SOS response-associated peptidase YedK